MGSRKFKIGINGRSMGGNVQDGISNVATNLFLNFPTDPEIEWVVFSPHEKLFPEIEAKGGFTHIHPKKNMKGGIWFYSKLVSDLRRFPVDVFWSPNQLLPPFMPSGCKTVITIHDFTYLKFPETMNTLCRWNLKLRGSASIRVADILVAVSESTVKDLRSIANPQADIRVIPNGINPKAFFPDTSVTTPLEGLDRPDYFLSVGSIEPRKNLGIILDAYEALFEETDGDCPRWVVVYSNTWGSDALVARMKAGKASKGILMKRNVKTDELRRIYSNAIALVFPSIYEGFGLPMLEAMACNCPVVASNIEICKEVCQDVAFYLKDFSKESIFASLAKTKNKKNNVLIIKKAFDRSKLFYWSNIAPKYLEIFKL